MSDLQVGAQYRDARGRVWTVHSFLYDEGKWMVEDPSGDYVHVTTPAARPRYRGAKDGKFVKAKTFAKGVTFVAAPSPDATEGR